jgi:hypothetical protein
MNGYDLTTAALLALSGGTLAETSMRTYVITSGAIFGLITLAHLVRLVLERRLIPDPVFIIFTLISAGLTIWAWRVLRP